MRERWCDCFLITISITLLVPSSWRCGLTFRRLYGRQRLIIESVTTLLLSVSLEHEDKEDYLCLTLAEFARKLKYLKFCHGQNVIKFVKCLWTQQLPKLSKFTMESGRASLSLSPCCLLWWLWLLSTSALKSAAEWDVLNLLISIRLVIAIIPVKTKTLHPVYPRLCTRRTHRFECLFHTSVPFLQLKI